jgi:E3 ubiquitin-protein ligase SspH2
MEEAHRRIRRWKKLKNPRKWLNLSDLDLTELPPIPSKVRRLNCSFNSISSLSNLPKRLRRLKCDLTNDAKLPRQLTYLWCGGDQFVQLIDLPNELLTIYIYSAPQLTSIDKLPDSIQHIYIRSCNTIRHIYHLPKNLKVLDIWYMYKLESIAYFPRYLETTRIRETVLTKLPPLPLQLQHLVCYYSRIEYLPQLPSNLKELNVYANRLKGLPSFPDTLLKLDVRSNYFIYSLPRLPDHLLELLTDLPCTSLILPQGLLSLECAGAEFCFDNT